MKNKIEELEREKRIQNNLKENDTELIRISTIKNRKCTIEKKHSKNSSFCDFESVVIDNGTSSIKAGLAGDSSLPDSVIPTLLGRANTTGMMETMITRNEDLRKKKNFVACENQSFAQAVGK